MTNTIQVSIKTDRYGEEHLFCIPLTSIKYVENALQKNAVVVHWNDGAQCLYVSTSYEDIIKQLKEI
jgi:hypothetical protein